MERSNPCCEAATPGESPGLACAHCGYDLRGLDRHRCPECGRPFLPASSATPTAQRWPALLICLLAAGIGLAVIEVVGVVRFWSIHFGALSGVEWYLARRASDATTATTLMFAPIAIGGLWRGRRWGVVSALALMASTTIVCLIGTVLRSPDDRTREGLINVMLSLVLIWYLQTTPNLVPIRTPGWGQPQSSAAARRDWVPLMCVIFLRWPLEALGVVVGVIVRRSLPFADWIQALEYAQLQSVNSQLHALHGMIHYLGLWAGLLWGVAGIACLWIRPRSARWVTGGLLAIEAVVAATAIARTVFSSCDTGHPAGGGLVYELSIHMDDLLVPLAMTAFAVWCVPRRPQRGAQPGA